MKKKFNKFFLVQVLPIILKPQIPFYGHVKNTYQPVEKILFITVLPKLKFFY